MALTTRPRSSHDERRRDVIEDVIWLTDNGEAPEQVARQLGYLNADSLARVLERWGEPSLARRLTRGRGGVWAA